MPAKEFHVKMPGIAGLRRGTFPRDPFFGVSLGLTVGLLVRLHDVGLDPGTGIDFVAVFLRPTADVPGLGPPACTENGQPLNDQENRKRPIKGPGPVTASWFTRDSYPPDTVSGRIRQRLGAGWSWSTNSGQQHGSGEPTRIPSNWNPVRETPPETQDGAEGPRGPGRRAGTPPRSRVGVGQKW